jgi:hypothetical protein
MPAGGSYTVDGNNATSFDPSQGAATYSVVYEFTDNNNCTNDATESIVVNAAPVVDLGDDVEICGDAEATLDAGAQDAYSWSTGDSTQTITVQTSGTYDVTVTNSDGCSNNSSVNVSYEAVCVGVNEQLAENTEVVYFPNPANNSVQLDAAGFTGDVRLSVADLNGRVLYEATIESNNSVYTHNVDVSTFESGVYLFQLQSDKGVVTHRVTVSR